MSEPRAYTAEEARAMFLEHAHSIATYWANVPNKTPTERCHGVVFSLLVMLDGGSGGMPGFDVYPAPHPDDMDYLERQGENWWSDADVINDCQLHEQYVKINKPLEPKKCKTCAQYPTPGWIPAERSGGWVQCPTCQG